MKSNIFESPIDNIDQTGSREAKPQPRLMKFERGRNNDLISWEGVEKGKPPIRVDKNSTFHPDIDGVYAVSRIIEPRPGLKFAMITAPRIEKKFTINEGEKIIHLEIKDHKSGEVIRPQLEIIAAQEFSSDGKSIEIPDLDIFSPFGISGGEEIGDGTRTGDEAQYYAGYISVGSYKGAVNFPRQEGKTLKGKAWIAEGTNKVGAKFDYLVYQNPFKNIPGKGNEFAMKTIQYGGFLNPHETRYALSELDNEMPKTKEVAEIAAIHWTPENGGWGKLTPVLLYFRAPGWSSWAEVAHYSLEVYDGQSENRTYSPNEPLQKEELFEFIKNEPDWHGNIKIWKGEIPRSVHPPKDKDKKPLILWYPSEEARDALYLKEPFHIRHFFMKKGDFAGLGQAHADLWDSEDRTGLR